MLGTYEFRLTSDPRNSHLKDLILKTKGLTRLYFLLAFLFVLDAAMAASIEFPPCFKIEMASSEAKGWDVAANPFEFKMFDLFGDWRFVILNSSLGYIILAELFNYNSHFAHYI